MEGLRTLVGQQFDGSPLPLSVSFLLGGLTCLALVLVAERGELFKRRTVLQAV